MGLWSDAIRPYPSPTTRRQSAKDRRKAERHTQIVPPPSLPAEPPFAPVEVVIDATR
jgi:hypothetical protein